MYQMIEVSKLSTSKANPRRELKEIEGLALSIAAHGIIEPLVVTPADEEGFTILAGHRRAAAAAIAGLETVPCVVRMGVENHSKIHLIENEQREGLLPAETALAVYNSMQGGTKLKQKDLGKEIGKSEAWVSKYALIGKAYVKLMKAESDQAAVMFTYTDAEKLYKLARKVMGLDKNEDQDELEAGEPAAEDEAVESEVMQELRDLVQAWLDIGGTAMHKAGFDVVPTGKVGYNIVLKFKTERAVKAAFEIESTAGVE